MFASKVFVVSRSKDLFILRIVFTCVVIFNVQLMMMMSLKRINFI